MTTKKAPSQKASTTHDHDHDHDHDHHLPAQDPNIAENETVKLTLAWKDIQKAYQSAITKAAKQVKLAGFRQGKVPVDIAKKNVNLERVVADVVEKVTPAAFQKVIADKKLQPIVRPEVQPLKTEENQDWEVEVTFAQRPEIKLSDYAKVAKKALKDAAQDLKEALKNKQEQAKKKAEATGTKDSKTKKDEKIELTQQEEEDIKLKNVFKALVTSIKPKVAEQIVRQEANHRIDSFLKQLSQFQLDPQDYLKSRGQSVEQFVAEKRAEALAALQIEFILQAITDVAKIKVTDKDIEAKIAEITDEKLKAQAQKDDGYKHHLEQRLAREKVTQHLLDLS